MLINCSNVPGRFNVLRCNNYCPDCGIHIFTTEVTGLDYRGENKCVCVVVDGGKIDGIELSNHSDCFASVNASGTVENVHGNAGNDLLCFGDIGTSVISETIYSAYIEGASEPPLTIVTSCVSWVACVQFPACRVCPWPGGPGDDTLTGGSGDNSYFNGASGPPLAIARSCVSWVASVSFPACALGQVVPAQTF